MATYAEQLAEVQAAISAVMTGGQSYTIGTGSGGQRSKTRANLAELQARERYLKPLADAEARGTTGRRTRQIAPG